MAEEGDVAALVIDNGSGMCKAGFAGKLDMCPLPPSPLVTSTSKTHPPTEPISQQNSYMMGTFPD